MLKRHLAAFLGCLAGLYAHTASATIIGVDADPGTAGIQTTRTVAPGAMFTVDVVLNTMGDPAPTGFDTTVLAVSFNDAGAVLTSGAARAGAVAGPLFSLVTFDFFTFALTAPGTTLTPGPSVPAGGFANDTSQVGLFSGLFLVPAGGVTTLFSFDFTAGAAPGTSTLLASNTTGSELALGGLAVPGVGLAPATITVQSAVAVPEPGTLLLFGTGLLGIAFMRRRHRA